MYKHAPEYGWSIGHCSSSQEWKGPGIYSEKCCFADKKYILSCITTNKNGDWSSTVLMMLGHRFCNDVVDHNASLTIDISGDICICLLYTSPSPRDGLLYRMPSTA